MPNHCHNDLYIHGTDENVAKVLEAIKTEDRLIDFDKIIPYPKHFKALDDEREKLGREGFAKKYGQFAKDGYNSGGYEWCCDNWGTKWNAYRAVRRDYEGVCITFQTAWAPPKKVIAALAKMFPECRFDLEYFERGMGFCGGLSFVPEDEWYDDDTSWEPGAAVDEWESREYRGSRGG